VNQSLPFSFRTWGIPGLMLGISVVAVTRISGVVFLALGFFLALVLLLLQTKPWKLRKLWEYGAVVPFALWYLFVPGGNSDLFFGISRWVLWIPAWYFVCLGMIQLYSLGNGGERRFVWWNSAAVMGLSGFQPDRISWILMGAWTILLALDLRREAIPGRSAFRLGTWLTWLVMLALLGLGSVFQGQIRGSMWSFALHNSSWNPGRTQMKGFDPASWLGSFSSEYDSPFERQIALRVFTQEEPRYMRAVVHATYISGIWRMAPLNQKWMPRGNYLEYSLFGPDVSKDSQLATWVLPSLRTFGFYFAPAGTGRIGVVGDSLWGNSAGVFRSIQQQSDRGYYLYRPGDWDSLHTDEDLLVPGKLVGFLDTIKQQKFASNSWSNPDSAMQNIRKYFEKEYRYELRPLVLAGQDPLRGFVQQRAGYCEYFATLATLLLRHGGVAARYVTGFAAPERVGDAWVFRRADAHAWVEVFVPGRGWVTFDPTPPSSFFRVPHLSAWERIQEGLKLRGTLFLHTLRDGSWKLIVDRIGTTLQKKGDALLLFLSFLAGTLLLWGFWRKRKSRKIQFPLHRNAEVWVKKLNMAERKLRSKGLVREPWEPVGDWLARLPPDADPQAVRVLREYQQGRFREI
jgi:hypothetical protein